MEWMPPSPTASQCAKLWALKPSKSKEASVKEVTIIGVDLAKNVFQLHGAAADGSVVFRKKLTRVQFHKFMSGHPACLVAMEACGSAHYWAREVAQMGHDPRLIAPRYVKPFVKRHKNDTADAEAIVEAALRPTMRFVDPKTPEQQGGAVLFRTRAQFIRQRTEAINALRAHLYEFGYIAPTGVQNVKQLALIVEADSSDLPALVRFSCRELIEQITRLTERLAVLDKEISRLSGQGEVARRLRTMPGVGPITALAVETFAPVMESFRCGRDFAAWLGLVPLQRSTGGKQILGKTSKMGQRDIRRLLIVGAMAVVGWAGRRGAVEGSWLAKMLARKPRMLVAIALANKMARGLWAMLTKNEEYRGPVMVG
nr:IS110 family transposase [Roseovarius autotrophicus]